MVELLLWILTGEGQGLGLENTLCVLTQSPLCHDPPSSACPQLTGPVYTCVPGYCHVVGDPHVNIAECFSCL